MDWEFGDGGGGEIFVEKIRYFRHEKIENHKSCTQKKAFRGYLRVLFVDVWNSSIIVFYFAICLNSGINTLNLRVWIEEDFYDVNFPFGEMNVSDKELLKRINIYIKRYYKKVKLN
ncbi:MAG: hypothetical protein ACI9JY_001642 [Saprospiraceae bacterium]